MLTGKQFKAFKRHAIDQYPKLAREIRLDALLRLALQNVCIPHYRRYLLREDCFYANYRDVMRLLGEDYREVLGRTGLVAIVGDYSRTAKLTYPYQVTAKFLDLLLGFQSALQLTNLCINDTNFFPLANIPKYCISSRDTRLGDNKRKTIFQLNAFVPLNVSMFSNVHSSVKRWMDELDYLRSLGESISSKQQSRSDKLLRLLGSVALILMKLCRHPSSGELGVIETYKEHLSGRLYGDGLSLQNVPKEVRKALFTGYTDWDFDACHPAIAAGFMKRQGVELSALATYVHSKTPIRRNIAADLGLEDGLVKLALTAITYGASLSGREGSAIVELVGKEGCDALRSHPFVRAVTEELIQARKTLLTYHTVRTAKGLAVRNALGKDLLLADVISSHPDLTLIAHILQGYEAYMLDTVMLAMADDDGITHQVNLIQHDGFTSRLPYVEGLATGLDAIANDPRLGWEMYIPPDKLDFQI